ncbi:MAG: nuclear transport factor 2 family protein [Polyangiaceae bacterium]|nr:nuclear transport factor 2 family protein [Polyangiaceae bacterium]
MSTSDDEAVLASNKAFYTAFEALDAAAMDAVWSSSAPVTCIHPGWAPVTGRDRVLDSWSGIFRGTDRIRFELNDIRTFISGDHAWVILMEEIEAHQAGQLVRAYAITTNIFVREEAGWKMVHHHAGPTPPPSKQPKASVLH